MTDYDAECLAIRHGETEWSRDRRHTGRTDLPLLPEGREQAEALRSRLEGREFTAVLVSPLQRAVETCRLAGLGDRAEVEPDLLEWDYGEYEGRTTVDIHRGRPDWDLFEDGAPGGETAADVGVRVDRVIARVRALSGDVALVAHAHLLRVLAARWVDLPPDRARSLTLGPASLSVLGWERTEPVISRWNLY
jgi:probable phosphoglycerate mutase